MTLFFPLGKIFEQKKYGNRIIEKRLEFVGFGVEDYIRRHDDGYW
jgi:hypothetical protein